MNKNDWKYWHTQYENADRKTQQLVDDASQAAANVFNAAGRTISWDDRAERLVAACMQYLVESDE